MFILIPPCSFLLSYWVSASAMSHSTHLSIKLGANQPKQDQTVNLGAVFKLVASSGIILFFLYVFAFRSFPQISGVARVSEEVLTASSVDGSEGGRVGEDDLNISHIVFGLVGSVGAWKHRKAYIESWWRPNVTRGYLFLDGKPTNEFLPWSSGSPPFRVSEDVQKYRTDLNRPLFHRRIVHAIVETYRQGDKDVRWYVMGDDDTIVFTDNLVRVLSKYDHTKYYYIGTNSECVKSGFDFSFEMAFGGGGIVLSAPLAKALASTLDACVARYPYIWAADMMTQSCLADLGVDLTLNRGFHQFDLHGDLSGLLSSHWKTPLITLHHIDVVDPIFPSKNRSESLNHLMKAANVGQSRLMQQTICHDRRSNWTFSVSWGYSVHIYESILSRGFLRKPLETFKPWMPSTPPLYIFNTRSLTRASCKTPHIFFFHSIDTSVEGQIRTTYLRNSSRNMPPCSSNPNHSAESINEIQVFTQASDIQVGGQECCDVLKSTIVGKNAVQIRYRTCHQDEILA